MRRARLTVLALAAAASAGAPAFGQAYDRYGGVVAPGGYYPVPAQQGRVLTWNGKQTAPMQPAPPTPPYQPVPRAYYGPPGAYPQQAYPQQAYPEPEAPARTRYGVPQQQRPPQQQQAAPAHYSVQQPYLPQPYPAMYAPPYGAQQPYGQQAYPAYPSQPQAAYQQPLPYGQQQQPYQQQPQTYPAQAYPQQQQQQTGFQPQAYFPVDVVTQPMIAPTRVQSMSGQGPSQMTPAPMTPAQAAQAMPPPILTNRNAEPPVSAAPSVPVQSQPLPTSIYDGAQPRAELGAAPAEAEPAQSGGTALAMLQPPRHYSVHRPFGIAPDRAPAPRPDNSILFAAVEAELIDQGPTGLRGVGMDEDKPAKKSDD